MKRQENIVACIDVGGTNWRSAHFINGEIVDFRNGEWDRSKSPSEGIAYIKEIVKEFDVKAVGVAFPGLIDRDGNVNLPPNLPQWDRVPLKRMLEEELSCPVEVLNDATAYALGEWRYGAAEGFNNVLVVTLGTGVGGGLILDGKPYFGTMGFAGEFGHIFVEGRAGKRCGCGSFGCLESELGVIHFMKRVESKFNEMGESVPKDLRELSLLAREGDRIALELWIEYGSNLGRAIGSVLNLLDLEIVVVGGGVSKSFDLFKDELMESVRENSIGFERRKILVVDSKLKDRAALYGVYEFIEKRRSFDLGFM